MRLKVVITVLLTCVCSALAISPQAKTYLDTVLDLLEKHYVRSETLNWPELRQLAYQLAANAQQPSDTYLAIRQVMAVIGDWHMLFIPAQQASEAGTVYGGGLEIRLGGNTIIRLAPGGPAQKAGLEVGDEIETVDGRPLVLPSQLQNSRYAETLRLSVFRARTEQRKTVLLTLTKPLRPAAPSARILGGRIGYLDLPQHSIADSRHLDYALVAQQAIWAVEAQSPCGWVVDLRNNAGGLLYPIILAAGPLLGEGRVGGLVTPRSSKQWLFQQSRMLEKSDSGAREVGRFNQPPDKLPSADRPAAVLIGPKTISAGEALAIAFIGRPNTRLFGEPSFGFTTANLAFSLPDGALIAIPFAFFADRNGNHYDQQIEPDETLFTDWSLFQSEKDEVLQGAKAWLQTHPGCQSATP